MAYSRGTTSPPSSLTPPLCGRGWILDKLQDWYRNGSSEAILMGPPGIGKSRLAKALGESVEGAALIDFSLTSDPFLSLQSCIRVGTEGTPPSLLILDSIENAPPIIWRSQMLNTDFPNSAKLFVFRAGVHFEEIQKPGMPIFSIDPYHPLHQEDLACYLGAYRQEQLELAVTTFKEAEFLISDSNSGLSQLDGYYLSLWRETTRSFQGPTRILIEQIALLLADSPESLSLGTISDFTGVPMVMIREAIDYLAPLLSPTPGGVTLFSPGLANFLIRSFSRDLGPVHGRVVSFFRETYPSWQEMHDPYGWRYLVQHCERLARASRRQDFSVLHWLNEGSFSQLKLERTGMLPSVLEDLRLSLVASLDSEDIPRIVSFGSRIARLRKQESIKTVHRLADSGFLQLARENAFLVSGEGEKYLLWILFATQVFEDPELSTTSNALAEGLIFPVIALEDTKIKLAANLIATMLGAPKLDDETKHALLNSLSMQGSPEAYCIAHKTAGSSHLLTAKLRKELLLNAKNKLESILDGELRAALEREINMKLARLDAGAQSEDEVAYPCRLLKATNHDQELAEMVKEVQAGSLSIASAAAALIPLTDTAWVNAAFYQLIELLNQHKDEDLLRHGLTGLLQSLEDAHVQDIQPRLLDSLSLTILSFDKSLDRSHFLARFAVMLSVKNRPLDAQQRISLAAANAFSITDTATRASALFYLASQVAATGALSRARDLSFHALELETKVNDLDRESRQLVRLLSTAATKNDSAEEIVRLGESLRFEASPLEIEAKGRAMIVLAAGLSRLGAESQARSYRKKAIEATRSIEDGQTKIHLLCDLASALHQSGEKRQARKLAKEARTLFDEIKSESGLLATTALLKVSMVLENPSQTKKSFQLCLDILQTSELSTWLNTPSFVDLLGLSIQLGCSSKILEHIEKARIAPELSDNELLGLLRCELELAEFERAEVLLDRISDVKLRCQAGIDLGLARLSHHPELALRHLVSIPLESERSEGIRRMAILNSCEVRPTEQVRVRHVLSQLTLMAVDNPDAMDAVLSRWIQKCASQEIIAAVADKMSWSIDAARERKDDQASIAQIREDKFVSKFLEVKDPQPSSAENNSHPVAHGSDDGDPKDSHSSSGISDNDEGFKVISLTKPRA